MKISTVYAKAKGFTLIELLVVIAILATLAGIAYPLITGQIEKARIKDAKNVCASLVNGVESFMKENNNRMPFSTDTKKGAKHYMGGSTFYMITADGQDGGLITILANRENGKRRRNIADKPFISTDATENRGSEGLYNNNGDWELYDPWGNPYHVIVRDDDYDCHDPFTGQRQVGKRCLAYSLGPDGKGEADVKDFRHGLRADNRSDFKMRTSKEDEEEQEDNVYSWKEKK